MTMPVAQTKERLSVSSLATLYGCCGLFDVCGDADLMSLSLAGASPFLDWIGWERSDVCKIVRNFITWVRADGSGARSAGYLSDACADPNGVDFGTCDFTLEDFARLRRAGPTRDVTKANMRFCEAQPRYRLDGSPINDDMEYAMLLASEVVLQDLAGMLVTGNAATPGQFSGLQTLIKTGYTNSGGYSCSAMDSIVIDWNANPLTGGAGITWNGAAVGTGYDFIDVLLAVFRRIKTRISMAKALAGRRIAVGDIVLMLPSSFLQCVLDKYTCWSVCPGAQYNEANLNTFEARRFRDQLMGGLFGDGKIFLDGFEIPLVGYDYGTILGPTRFDAYFLTGSVGGVKLMNGQYNNMSFAASQNAKFSVTDGGRILTWQQDDHTCLQHIVEMQPRLLMSAPWAEARITDIRCAVPGGILSVDPWETSFFPETSFDPANCPT